MLSPIDHSNRIHALASAIRRAVAARGTAAGAAQRRTNQSDTQDTLTTLVERARSIPSNHPRRAHQALRLFIEGVLLEEFGSHLPMDPAFQVLVDDVVCALEQSDEYGEDCTRLGRSLLGESDEFA